MTQRTDNKTILIGAVALGTFIIYLSSALVPFFAGLVLACLFRPLTRYLESKGIPTWISSSVLTLTMYIALFAGALLLIPSVRHLVSLFLVNMPFYKAYFSELGQHLLQSVQVHTKNLLPLASIGDSMLQEGVQYLHSGFLHILQNSWVVAKTIAIVLLSPFISFYVMKDWDLMMIQMDKMIPLRYKNTVYSCWEDINKTLASYVRGQLVVCSTLSLYYGIALWAIGLQFGGLVGFLMGILTFIPYLGFLAGALSVFLLKLLQTNPPATLALSIIFTIGYSAEALVLTPILIGRRIGLHPVIVLGSVCVTGFLGGLWGIFFSYPLAAIGAALWRVIKKYYFNSSFYIKTRDAR